MSKKPLGRKAYGSIPHLLGSNRGPADLGVDEGQHKICCEKSRDGDRIVVQEKLDGTCVSVANVDGKILALNRAGYLVNTSPYEQHHIFGEWVAEREMTFKWILEPGERLVGEWLIQASGIRYDLENYHRQPFVPFDLMREDKRAVHDELFDRVHSEGFDTPPMVSCGPPIEPMKAMELLGDHGFYGADEKPEGVVYRVEKVFGKVEFLAKFVRSDFVPGKYLPGVGEVTEPTWNIELERA